MFELVAACLRLSGWLEQVPIEWVLASLRFKSARQGTVILTFLGEIQEEVRIES